MIRIGCAGWSLDTAEHEHFSPGDSHLARYASVFNAVEINSSFYRPHRPQTYARWANEVPGDFRFAVKIPKTVSHQQRLVAVDDLLAGFIAEAGCLGDKLGRLLLQLPPKFEFDAGVVAAFFVRLAALLENALSTPPRVVCEARHPSWFGAEAADLLAELSVTRVLADPPVVAPSLYLPTSDDRYVRLHGSPVMYRSWYSPAFLESAASVFIEDRRCGREVWCIFDNTAAKGAVPNARTLLHYVNRFTSGDGEADGAADGEADGEADAVPSGLPTI